MKPNLTIVKLGGGIINDENSLHSFLASFAKIQGRKILVHGGGKIASSIGKQLGIEPTLIEGRRVTDQETLHLVTMVYAGLLNKKIVASLQSKRCNAIGLSGVDGNLILATHRKAVPIDYGFVGDPVAVNVDFLTALLNADMVPVLAPITHDGNGQLLNTNADTIASSLASAMSKTYTVHLHFAFEKNGVLQDVENENSSIARLSQNEVEEMKNTGAIHSGMLPKLSAGFSALQNGATRVSIGSAFQIDEIISGAHSATLICL